MKKNKKKKFFSQKNIISSISIFFWAILIWIFSLVSVYAIDIIGDYIKTQNSTWTWTNNNKITFSKHRTTYYINKDDDNNFIWDELRWYYYDNIYWFFRLDWSTDISKNVHIDSWPSHIWTCTEAYKFNWKAYSKYMWYIDFNYNSTYFVYFCKDDYKIYWNTYSDNLWKQNLDWIKIEIKQKQVINKIEDKQNIQDDNNYIENNNSIDSTDKNWNNNSIWGWDKYEIENSTIKDSNDLDESVFWIIK